MTTNQYYVRTGLHHDGKAYGPGDRVSLSEKAAARLLASGVISAEKAPDPAPAPSNDRIQAPERKAELREAKVGGEPASSGEPSLDAQQPDERVEAEDISPKLEDMSRAQLDEQAAKEGVEAELVSKAPNKAAVIDLINGKRADAQQPDEPAVDASADL